MGATQLAEAVHLQFAQQHPLPVRDQFQAVPEPVPRLLHFPVLRHELRDQQRHALRVLALNRRTQCRKQVLVFVLVMMPAGAVEESQHEGCHLLRLGVALMQVQVPRQPQEHVAVRGDALMARDQHLQRMFEIRQCASRRPAGVVATGIHHERILGGITGPPPFGATLRAGLRFRRLQILPNGRGHFDVNQESSAIRTRCAAPSPLQAAQRPRQRPETRPAGAGARAP